MKHGISHPFRVSAPSRIYTKAPQQAHGNVYSEKITHGLQITSAEKWTFALVLFLHECYKVPL